MARSWMWEHVRDNHEDIVGESGGKHDYNVKMTGRFGRCLQRQVDEDIRMQECEAGLGVVLSRNEYFTPKSVHPLFRQL